MIKPFQTRAALSNTKGAVGFCIMCSAKATIEALFKLDEVVVIQRYCNACLSTANYQAGKY